MLLFDRFMCACIGDLRMLQFGHEYNFNKLTKSSILMNDLIL